MQTVIAKVFNSGNSQAIRLPKEFRMNVSEVYIAKSGERLIVSPRKETWDGFSEALEGGFSSDFTVKSKLPKDAPRASFK